MKTIKQYLLIEKTYEVLLALVLITIPLPYAFSSISIALLTAVSVFSVFFHKVKFRKELALPILLYILVLASLLWTINTGKSLRGIERQLPFLLLPLAFICMPSISKEKLFNALYWFSAFMALLAVFFICNGLVIYISEGTLSSLFYHNLVGPWQLNAIYVSLLVAVCLLFIIFYKKKTFLNIALGIILFIFLVLLSSKNVIFSTIICIMLGFLVQRISLKKIAVLGTLVLIISAVVLLTPLKNRVQQEFSSNIEEVLTAEKFNRVYPWTGTTLRVYQGRIFYELIDKDEVFLTGYGINAAKEKRIEKNKEYNLYWGYDDYNFHNQFIQTFAEIGVIGFLLIVFMLGALFKGYVSKKELLFLFVAILMTMIFLTETYIWRQRGMIHFLILYGILFKSLSFKNSAL
ncbi:O-antigen ligase family protein [Patiriisocius hiemis]|uniref:O-antigen ligase family protein n=1 Tax=Patiriisocius hiemis TaxID=3075604 RepID=A0ABU2YE86_9FLAO|nr:O-antigen ligase family protein [Constantimarinum sp. W242]MDT0555565.1 O-antigen ligase family protein [Constantimarinum sp. W242]